MSSVRRRSLAAATLAMAAALSLSACGTGFGAQTNQVYQPAVGANHRGEVDVLGTLLVANSDGSATVSASIVNNAEAAQTVTGVTATTPDGKQLAVRSLKTLLPLPHDVLVPLGGSSDAGGFRVVNAPTAGTYVTLTFAFSDTSEATIQAPIVARTAEYADVAGGDGLAPAEVSGSGE